MPGVRRPSSSIGCFGAFKIRRHTNSLPSVQQRYRNANDHRTDPRRRTRCFLLARDPHSCSSHRVLILPFSLRSCYTAFRITSPRPLPSIVPPAPSRSGSEPRNLTGTLFFSLTLSMPPSASLFLRSAHLAPKVLSLLQFFRRRLTRTDYRRTVLLDNKKVLRLPQCASFGLNGPQIFRRELKVPDVY